MKIHDLADILDRLPMLIQKQNLYWSLRLEVVSFEMPQTDPHTDSHTYTQRQKSKASEAFYITGM